MTAPARPDLRSAAVRALTRATVRPIFAHARPMGLQLRVLRAVVDGSSRLPGGRPRLPVHSLTAPVPGLLVTAEAFAPPGVLVYLHGGGYVAGSPRTARSVAEVLARLTRMPVVVPAYRRAPEHPFPAALNDGLAVLRHLRACGVPPGRTAVAGDSAGAHLAITLTAALVARREPPPAALALFSPILDPASDAIARRNARAPDPMLPPVFALRCASALTNRLAGDPATDDPRLTPLAAADDVLAAFPPVLSRSGGTECVVDDVLRFHRRLSRLGVPSEYRALPGQVHGFVALHRLLPSARIALRDAADFLVAVIEAPGRQRITPDAGHRAAGDDRETEASP